MAIVHGEWPRNLIDHVDGNRSNNRLLNLRAATAAQNNCNRPKEKQNISGYKGVVPERNAWRASICVNGKKHNLGLFQSREEAAVAYNAAAPKYHGDFARLNAV